MTTVLGSLKLLQVIFSELLEIDQGLLKLQFKNNPKKQQQHCMKFLKKE